MAEIDELIFAQLTGLGVEVGEIRFRAQTKNHSVISLFSV